MRITCNSQVNPQEAASYQAQTGREGPVQKNSGQKFKAKMQCVPSEHSL
jgi:hypothetical protein